MPIAFTDEAVVAARPEAVWARLTDWAAAPQWMPGVTAMRAEGPLAASTELVYTARGTERRSTIAAVDPGRALTLRSRVGGVTADYAYTLRPDGDGTRIRLEADVATTGVVTLFAPLLRRAIAREDGAQLTRLARLVEHREPAG